MKRPVDGADTAIEFVQNGRGLVDQAFVVDGNDQARGSNDVVGNLDGGRDDLLQILNEMLKSITVQALGEHDKLRTARAEYATSAAGEREHAAGIFGQHGIYGVGAITLVELGRTANANGDQPRLAIVAAAAINGIDQHALSAEPRGGVDGFNKGMVDELADIERRHVSVSVDAIASDATEHVVAVGVAHAILHNAIVL